MPQRGNDKHDRRTYLIAIHVQLLGQGGVVVQCKSGHRRREVPQLHLAQIAQHGRTLGILRLSITLARADQCQGASAVAFAYLTQVEEPGARLAVNVKPELAVSHTHDSGIAARRTYAVARTEAERGATCIRGIKIQLITATRQAAARAVAQPCL